MPAKNNKVEEVSTVTNTFFNAVENKKVIKIAGICKAIEDKETPYAVAKRFKGDFALEGDTETYRAKYLFLPNKIRDSLLSGVSKLGKWTSFEFVITLTRVKELNEDKSIKAADWNIEINVAPRIEKPRVLSLLDA